MNAYDFQPYSPGSRHWIDFAEADELQLLGAEVQRTLDVITLDGARRIDKGQLTRAELETLTALWRAIAADLANERTGNGELHTVAWTGKVAELRREIEARRKSYPADVDKGRLAPADARQQLERLEAVQYHYWNMGFAFDGERAACRAHAYALADALEASSGGARQSETQSRGDSSTRAPGFQPEDGGSTPPPRSTEGAML